LRITAGKKKKGTGTDSPRMGVTVFPHSATLAAIRTPEESRTNLRFQSTATHNAEVKASKPSGALPRNRSGPDWFLTAIASRLFRDF